jgi:hypothetical protein
VAPVHSSYRTLFCKGSVSGNFGFFKLHYIVSHGRQTGSVHSVLHRALQGIGHKSCAFSRGYPCPCYTTQNVKYPMNVAVTHTGCLSPAFAALLPRLRITVLAILRQAPQASYGLSTRSHCCVISDLDQRNQAIAPAATCQDQFLGKSLSPHAPFRSSGRVSVTTR